MFNKDVPLELDSVLLTEVADVAKNKIAIVQMRLTIF